MVIYYVIPKVRLPIQSAGVRRLHRQIKALRKEGLDVYALEDVQRPLFKRLLPTKPSLEYVRNLYLHLKFLTEKDIIVVPEIKVHLASLLKDIPCKKVVYNLGPQNTYRNLQKAKAINYQEIGFSEVLCASGVVKDFLEYAMDIKVIKIPNFLDIEKYFPKETSRKTDLCFIKNLAKGRSVLYVLDILHSRKVNFSYQAMIGLDEEGYIKALQESRIYLSVTIPKGIPTDCLEAMACGTIVIGYAGIGGKEYLQDGYNCFLVEDNDYFNLAKKTENVLLLIKHKDPLLKDIKKNALKTAQQFSQQEKETKALVSYFSPDIS